MDDEGLEISAGDQGRGGGAGMRCSSCLLERLPRRPIPIEGVGCDAGDVGALAEKLLEKLTEAIHAGKTHRPPMPTDPGATRADSQAAKMRAAKTMVKTHRRRGRG